MPLTDLEVRPSAAEIRRRAAVLLPAQAAVVGLGMVRILSIPSSMTGRVVMFSVALLVLLGTAAVTLAYARRARVVVSPDALRYRGLLRSHQFWRSQLCSVLRWTSQTYGRQPSQRVVLVGPQQRRLPFVFDGALWGSEGLNKVIEALGLPVEEFPDATSASAKHPHALPMRDAHPARFSLCLAASIMLALMIGVLAFQTVTG